MKTETEICVRPRGGSNRTMIARLKEHFVPVRTATFLASAPHPEVRSQLESRLRSGLSAFYLMFAPGDHFRGRFTAPTVFQIKRIAFISKGGIPLITGQLVPADSGTQIIVRVEHVGRHLFQRLVILLILLAGGFTWLKAFSSQLASPPIVFFSAFATLLWFFAAYYFLRTSVRQIDRELTSAARLFHKLNWLRVPA